MSQSPDMANSILESLASVPALIVNPSTPEDTITVVSQTLSHYLQQNQQLLLLHHHVLKLLSDLAHHHHSLSHFVFNTVRAYALVCDDSRLIVQALAVLIMIAEQSQSSSLESTVAEISEDFLLSLSLSPYVSVRSWILSNALRFQLQPRHLVTMFLGFTNDPYPNVKSAALDGLVSLSSSYDIDKCELVEECYNRAVDLLLDTNACVRCAAIHVVTEWGQKLVVSDHKVGKKDAVFVKICSMVRDMSMEVRNEAFLSLGKIKSVSEDMLLQTLSKKILRRYATKEFDLPASNVAGAFVHGLEDEFYEVRRSACNSLGMLTKFSIRFSNDALSLLMDMLNDDYMVVRLQTLETMYDMATCDRLKVQETHMHMFLGSLVDTNALIRCAARNILRLVKLQVVEIFKSSINGLLTNLEMYPEDEADIFSVLFNMGKNHGSFAVSFFKEVSEEIKPSCEGELSFDNARVAAILVLTIAAPLAHEHHVFNIPTEVYEYTVPFLGRISSSLRDVATQDTLLAYFSPCRLFNRFPGDSLGQEDCRNLVMEPMESSPAENSKTNETMNQLVPLSQISYETCGKFQSNIWDLMQRTSAQVLQQRETSLHEEVKENVDNILGVVAKIWKPIKSGCTDEARRTLRSCEEELATIVVDSHGFASLLAFASQYIRVIQSLAEVWIHFLPQRNFHAHRTGMLDLSLEKLDTSLRELRYQYVGMSKEEELHVLELILLACVMRLSMFEICFHHNALKRLHATISRVEVLQDEGSVELSDFVLELKKSLSEAGSLVHPFPFKRLIEFFSLKQMLIYGKIKHIKADLDVPGNDSEKPFPFISGLPLGITFQITLFNISSKDRLWLKMAVDKSIQYVYLDFSGNGGNEEIRKVTSNVPFYRTPKASSFTLRACIGKECPFEDTGNQAKGQGGPKSELTFLCSEKEIFVAAIERDNWI